MALRVILEMNRARSAAWLGRALATIRVCGKVEPRTRGTERELADSLIREVATFSPTVREHLARRLHETPELSTMYRAEAVELLALLRKP